MVAQLVVAIDVGATLLTDRQAVEAVEPRMGPDCLQIYRGDNASHQLKVPR